MEEQTCGTGSGGSLRGPQAHGRAKRNPVRRRGAWGRLGASQARRAGGCGGGGSAAKACVRLSRGEGGEGDLVIVIN